MAAVIECFSQFYQSCQNQIVSCQNLIMLNFCTNSWLVKTVLLLCLRKGVFPIKAHDIHCMWASACLSLMNTVLSFQNPFEFSHCCDS